MANPKAQAAKDKGNVAFKSGDYPLAIGHYTSALMADPRDPTYPLNRAAAYLKLGKNEDAERDCNTVLNLSPNNVKALFRRGQARAGMGKLLEAQKDFTDVLRIEPANTSAQEELKKAATLIQNEKAKKSKSPTLPMQASLDSSLTAKRRRVPIKILDASGAVVGTSAQEETTALSTTTNSPPSPPQPAANPTNQPSASAPPPKPDTLEPVSSRPLKPSSPPRAPAVPPALAAAAAALRPEEKEPSAKGQEKEKPKAASASFRDAKQARETARPSRAGGGIFKSSGQSTIFASRGGDAGAPRSGIEEVAETPEAEMASPPPAPAPAPTPASGSQPLPSRLPQPAAADAASTTLPQAPTTYFDFSRAWHSLRAPEEKWALINTIPPAKLPALCQTSLEPALLISILDVFHTLLSVRRDDGALGQTVVGYMQNFARIPRFSTLVLFLSKPEKEVVKGVWGLLGVEPMGAWRAVGY